ncbi:hypothetical protein B0J12DRAFT_385433 [Macrophomina phaseolina]|nr:hypothetical protein B0J12DRAFT_385433 [Macrophomina phaseolina]
MKFFGVLLSATAFLLPSVLADSHGLCACQYKTDGNLFDDATEQCCNEWGGSLTDVPAAGGIRFAGKYCQKKNLDGDAWYNCCNNWKAYDSACPW